MSLSFLCQLISDHWCILFPLGIDALAVTDRLLPLQQIQMEMTSQVTDLLLFSKQTCYFAHDFLWVNVSLHYIFLARDQLALKERDVGYQALDCDTHILYKWPYYGPRGLKNSPRLLNNQSHCRQGDRQGRLETSLPLPLVDDFYLSMER